MALFTESEKTLLEGIKSFNEMEDTKISELHSAYTTGRPAFREAVENKVIEKNEYLVLACIRKYFPTYNGQKNYMDDLVQAGRIAIFQQLGSYDPEKGRFSTYIMSHMVGHMKTVLSENYNNIPKHYYTKWKKIEAAIEYYKSIGYDNPTIGMISEYTGLPSVTIKHTLSCKSLSSVKYIEEMTNGELSMLNEDVQEIVEDRIERGEVKNAVSRLSGLYRTVVALSFGLADSVDGTCVYGKAYSDTEIASILKKLNLAEAPHPEKIKKIRADAMEALRRDPSIARLCGGRRSKKENILQDFTLTLLSDPSVIECETRKLDALDGEGLDFDFSTEVVSSTRDENNSVELASMLEEETSLDELVKISECALDEIAPEEELFLKNEDLICEEDVGEESGYVYESNDISSMQIADTTEADDDFFAAAFGPLQPVFRNPTTNAV